MNAATKATLAFLGTVGITAIFFAIGNISVYLLFILCAITVWLVFYGIFK